MKERTLAFPEFTEQLGIKTTVLKNAAVWMQEPLEELDPILDKMFDKGDKLVIIGSSKTRKTFFTLQMILSLAAGRSFLGWDVPASRTVLHIQYEIQPHHFQRRLQRMTRALNISSQDLGDRLFILNARGQNLTGQAAIEKIKEYAKEVSPDLISIDPFYKVLEGDENSNGRDGMKGTLTLFDGLVSETEAALSYVHHDAKGAAGDRQTTDRGAGGGILGRDYDAAIILTPHATEEETYVVEMALRNYPPQAPFTIQWAENEETGGYRFERRADIAPEKKTSKTRTAPLELSTYLPVALSIIGEGTMEITKFKKLFKRQSGLSDHRIQDFIKWATAGGNPVLLTEEERGIGVHKKWIYARVER